MRRKGVTTRVSPHSVDGEREVTRWMGAPQAMAGLSVHADK